MRPGVVAAVAAVLALQLSITGATLTYVVSIEHRLTRVETLQEKKP